MDALVTCLASSLSSEPAVRQQAETSLEQRAYPINDPQGAYGIELARVFADNTVSLPLRQAAGIALKKYVYERWSIYFDEYLRQATTANAVGDAGAVPEDAKHTVHLLLLEALGDAAAYLCGVLMFSLTLVNTTLCLLNMLPIAPLDGGAYARLVLVEAYAWRHGDVSDTYVLDADEEEAEEAPWAARVERVLWLVQVVTYALCAMALVRSLVAALHYVR